MQDASEIIRYDEVGIPLYIREGLLSSYPDHRALCHWHEDIEWVQIRSGQMNYYINGKRVLLNAGEAIIVNSRQMHYGYSENGQECDFICILCHPKILTANSVLYQSYITPVLSNPALEYLHLKPENPEDTEALQTLPEILRLKKEQPTAYEIEAAALLSLLWCRLLRTHPMMPDGNTAVSQDPDLLIQRDMVSYIYSHYSESINLEEIAAAGKVCRNKCCQIFRRYLCQSPIDFLNHYRLEVSLSSAKHNQNVHRGNLYRMRFQSSEPIIPKSFCVLTIVRREISGNAQKSCQHNRIFSVHVFC